MKISRKTWILIGLAVLLIVLVSWSVKEGFESAAQFSIFQTKLTELAKTPHFAKLSQMYPGQENSLPVAFKFAMPLMAVGLYGDVVGNDLRVKQSQLEAMLSGEFPFDSVITLDKAYQVATVLGSAPPDKQAFVNDPNVKKMYVDFPKKLYFLFTKGMVLPSQDFEANRELNKQLDDPSDRITKRWTEEEKQWLRTAAGMMYTIVPDTPAAPPVLSAPSPAAAATTAASAYSASCSKCTMVNNQLTCTCDVLPK